MWKKKRHTSNGQALVEFALIIIVLLAIIFLIIEASRILWGWITVQSAAREGARYATTGQFDGPDCAVNDLPKFTDRCDDLRVASVISKTHTGLGGLPLNETSFTHEDEFYYYIEVLGVDETGALRPDFAGIPEKPVVVRVTYRVPIITPLFEPIISSIPVYGQVTMNNESFGQVGGYGTGKAVPPALPPLPTFGPTPTPSPTPTTGPTPTNTHTPTHTPTATKDICAVQFEGSAVAGNTFVLVTGDIDSNVTIFSATNGDTLGSATLLDRDGHLCPGFADYNPPNLNRPLIEGEVLIAQSSDGSTDTTIVLAGTATPTHTPTFTPQPSPTPSNTPTVAPTATPTGPFIMLLPSCGVGPTVQFQIVGINWPGNKDIVLSWNGTPEVTIKKQNHDGFFQQTWTKNVADGVHEVTAEYRQGNTVFTYTENFEVPCPNEPPPTTTVVPTDTPAPPDLIIVGPPKLISTPPIVAYRPVQFGMVISNTGGIDVNSQFFVDLYFDPSVVLTNSIPITDSVGYMAVSSLAGGESKAITITAPLGFQNLPPNHEIYGMVDSVVQIPESVETNNISAMATADYVTPGPTPTPTNTPPPSGALDISGVVRSRITNWVPQFRALVVLVDEGTSRVIATTTTDTNGFYEFLNLTDTTTYTVKTCVTIDNKQYSGVRTGIMPPNPFVDVFMLPGTCS